MFLLHISRRATHVDLVKGLKHEARLTIYHETVLQREAVGMCDDRAGMLCVVVANAARHVHLYHGGGIRQSAGLQDKVLECQVFDVVIFTRIGHFSVYPEHTFLLHIPS